MKKLFFALIFLIPATLFLVSCEQITEPPPGMQASDGTYAGVIHLSYGSFEGDAVVERRDLDTGEWIEISWNTVSNFDDPGYNLPDNKLIPGQVYQYRMRAHTDDGGFSEYTAVEDGYTYEILPMTDITATRSDDNTKSKVIWTDPNDVSSLENWERMEYKIYQATAERPDDFQDVKTITPDHGEFASVDSTTLYLPSSLQGETLLYQVGVAMGYTAVDANSSGYSGRTDYTLSAAVEEGAGGGNGGGDGTGTIDYSRSNLGEILSSSNGIPYAETELLNNTIYLGVVKNANVAAYGEPAVYKYDGSWAQTGGTMPVAINSSTSLDAVSISVGTSSIYLAAVDHDSTYVHQSDGSTWSANLMSGNLGEDTSPSSIDIEVLSDDLYAAVTRAPDYDLQVLKWTGSDWQTVGGDAGGWLTSGQDIFNLGLENIGETLYLVYTVKNADLDHTLHIKHLEGSTWAEDLNWRADYITGIKIAGSNGDLYFISRTASFLDYPGGVYEVTSTSTVENLIPDQSLWFLNPRAISIDSEGNIIVTNASIQSSYPSINVYDGSGWSTVSGDFSDGTDPVTLNTIGTDIYYIYGNANNVTAADYPMSLLSSKFSK